VSWNYTGISKNPRRIPPERRGWYTAQEIASAVDRTPDCVRAWVKNGLLTAGRKQGARTKLHITVRAFKQFLAVHGHRVLAGRRVA
jgi:hypothetical protein